MTELKGFKFVATLVGEFKKIETDDATKYTTYYSKWKAINESDIDDAFESIYNTIVSDI